MRAFTDDDLIAITIAGKMATVCFFLSPYVVLLIISTGRNIIPV